MKLRFPVLVQSLSKDEGGPEICMQLWFHPTALTARGPLEKRVETQFLSLLRSHVRTLQEQPEHAELMKLAWCPEQREHHLRLHFTFKKRTVRVTLLVTTFELQGQRLGCLGHLGLYFQWPAETELESRVVDVLKEFLRKQDLDNPETLGMARKAWIRVFELRFDGPGPYVPPPPRSLLALLGAEEERSGGQELQRVGRKLEALPANQGKLLAREEEVAELRNWLQPKGPRNCILVVGPRQVGKTSIIRQCVRELSRTSTRQKPEHWLLTPGRLISGMSYVGQWESRLVKILRYMRKRNHALVLDDLPGLLHAGISRDSNLSVLGVLKPYLERRELRVVAEITPEALHTLRQRDPALVELFHIVRVQPTDARTSLRVTLASARRAEEWQGCTFSLEALQLVYTLCERYNRDAAFPGKAASMISQLAARYRSQKVEPEQVLDAFSQRSGLALRILDDRQTFSRQEVVEFLSQRILGQPEAVEACADAACMAKTRLQARERPIASFLFAGPTGVGKTESAKALAEFLFHTPAALVRVDLNEYVGDDAVLRLVGSFHRPQGFLTEVVRRQPFCVLLLDEVEKAHPDVLQLLLQLLGDGRLSDGLGRTTDFSQVVVILTSNLGSQEASQSIGLRSQDAQNAALTYRRAVESFFTPELFNRIDRIVPFQPLSRETVGQLAWSCLHGLLRREGLQRRQCLLEVSPAALEKLIDLGYHPQLGARALKRAVERHLTAPVAAELAAMPADVPTLIFVNDALNVEVTPLLATEQTPRLPLSSEALGTLLDRWESEWKGRGPGGLSSEELQEETLRYFELGEELRQLRERWRRTRTPSRARGGPRTGKAGDRAEKLPDLVWLDSAQWRRVVGSSDLFADVRALDAELRAAPPALADVEKLVLQLEMNRWQQLGRAHPDESCAAPSLSGRPDKKWEKAYRDALARWDVHWQGDRWEGPLAAAFAEQEQGIHLFLQERQFRLVRLGGTRRLVRLYAEGSVIDVRSGLWSASLDGLPWMLLAALPEEFR